jgi:hypothetical protein
MVCYQDMPILWCAMNTHQFYVAPHRRASLSGATGGWQCYSALQEDCHAMERYGEGYHYHSEGKSTVLYVAAIDGLYYMLYACLTTCYKCMIMTTWRPFACHIHLRSVAHRAQPTSCTAGPASSHGACSNPSHVRDGDIHVAYCTCQELRS